LTKKFIGYQPKENPNTKPPKGSALAPMNCTRCEKNEAVVRLDLTRIDEKQKLHGFLCSQCYKELIKLLYSCTCHIKEG